MPVTSNIIVNPIPQSILLTPQITGCVPLSWTLVADTTLQHTQFSWQVAGVQYSGDSISGVSYSGNCQDVTLTNTLNGCSQSTTYLNHICSENLPIAEFDASISYFSEATQEVSFNNLSVGFQNSVWNFGDGSQSLQENPNHQFVGNSAGWNISLLVSSQLGCQDTTSLFIPFQESLIFYIPNTFTPDGDKFNNTFKPVFTTGYDPYSYNMKIYNRWGEIIFETFNTQYGWDGYYGQDPLVCQSGVYTYFITFKLPGSEDWRQISGHVNLLR